ncbi:MAG: DUF2007 domain-containing protein, partial [Flavobacteriales bacterium]|nr:DUF2007 domain-containing protein [Flavobacteriales bacterium]
MEKGWILILSSTTMEVELKSALLKGRGINGIVLNKQDSSYLFGEAELYVRQDEVLRAKRILDEENA